MLGVVLLLVFCGCCGSISTQAWVLNGITLPIATIVAVLYWVFVFKPPLNPLSVCTHGLNLIVILVDAMVCSHTYVLSQYCVVLP